MMDIPLPVTLVRISILRLLRIRVIIALIIFFFALVLLSLYTQVDNIHHTAPRQAFDSEQWNDKHIQEFFMERLDGENKRQSLDYSYQNGIEDDDNDADENVVEKSDLRKIETDVNRANSFISEDWLRGELKRIHKKAQKHSRKMKRKKHHNFLSLKRGQFLDNNNVSGGGLVLINVPTVEAAVDRDDAVHEENDGERANLKDDTSGTRQGKNDAKANAVVIEDEREYIFEVYDDDKNNGKVYDDDNDKGDESNNGKGDENNNGKGNENNNDKGAVTMVKEDLEQDFQENYRGGFLGILLEKKAPPNEMPSNNFSAEYPDGYFFEKEEEGMKFLESNDVEIESKPLELQDNITNTDIDDGSDKDRDEHGVLQQNADMMENEEEDDVNADSESKDAAVHVNEKADNGNVLLKEKVPKDEEADSSQGVSSVQKLPPLDHGSQLHEEHAGNISDVLQQVNSLRTFVNMSYPPFVEHGGEGSPGYNGVPHSIDRNKLTNEDRKEKATAFSAHYFDEWVSRNIPLHRSLLDKRNFFCRHQSNASLTSVSVIMVFYNEAWSTLLRSVHSVLDRSPPHMLLEIVLVDDASTMAHLKDPLEAYVQPLTKVKLLRAKTRLGLIRARNFGALLSKGEIIVFLDSHVECFPGWLEPLISPIMKNKTTATVPNIGVIDDRSFKVTTGMAEILGSTDINTLAFRWLDGSRKSSAKVGRGKLTHRSATMPGGLYAISRDWFIKLGLYDPGMEWWGGENMEISFKIWMCGGQILICTCSNVAHVYRKHNPTVTPVDPGFRNYVRVAEVWMDEFKHFYYERHAYRFEDPGDLTRRRQLRESLQCRPFDWYLKHVDTDLKLDIDEASGPFVGHIESLAVKTVCLEAQVSVPRPHLSACKLIAFNQVWILSTRGKLFSLDMRIGVNKTSQALAQDSPRHPRNDLDTEWVYTKTQHIQNVATRKCLELQPGQGSNNVTLTPCTDTVYQAWRFQTRKEFQEQHKARGVPIDWSK